MYKNFVRFALRKLGIMILTVFLISFFVFFIITLPPGDFLTNYIGRMSAAGETVSPELVAQLKSNYGLDQPFIVQYWKWISNIIFHGDFGYSFALSMPVSAVIKAYIVPTMVLSLVTMIFTYLIAIPIGIYSAVHQYSVGDYLFTSVGFIGMAVPNFLMGIILMFISFKLTGNTMLGLYSPGMENAPLVHGQDDRSASAQHHSRAGYRLDEHMQPDAHHAGSDAGRVGKKLCDDRPGKGYEGQGYSL